MTASSCCEVKVYPSPKVYKEGNCQPFFSLKQENMDQQVFEISSTLNISIQKGDYGRYVKVQRKQRWIALSASLWNIIRENIEKLQTDGYVLHLTKMKRLEVINFANQRFVSLIEQRPDSDFKSFININDGEWSCLQTKMGNICAALIDCDACNNLKRPIVVLQNKRMAETKLKPKKVTKLEEYNQTVDNQLGIMCLYCGAEVRDDCHCHEYDCSVCEPQNFCTKCHVLTVYPAV